MSAVQPKFRTKTRFNHQIIIDAVGKATAGVLTRFGAFVRRTAKGLIRRGKKPSKPGMPPKSHGQDLLKKWISFDFDPSTRSEVIGPEKLNMVFFNGAGQPTKGTVPRVLEKGGDIYVLEWFLASLHKWQRADLRSKRKLAVRRTRLRKVSIAARPYMFPSFKKEIRTLPSEWHDSIARFARSSV